MQSTNGTAHAQFTALRLLERASTMFPDRVAIVDGARRITYRELACAQGVVPGLPNYQDPARPCDARDGVTEEPSYLNLL